VKQILHNKDCFVDGVICHDNKRPVGLMDVVSLPKASEFYRLLISKKNMLYAVKVSEKESQMKVCKIANKTSLKKGLQQLNATDGRNFLVKDAKKYSVGDSVQIELGSQKIIAHFPLVKGAQILLTSGKYVGQEGVLDSVDHSTAFIKIGDSTITTLKKFAFVVGTSKSVITL